MPYKAHDLLVAITDDSDNPYPDDSTGAMRHRFMKYRDEHLSRFNFIGDWRDNLHSREVYEPTEEVLDRLYGVFVTPETKLSDIPKLDNIVKGFFRSHPNYKFSELNVWASTASDLDISEDSYSDSGEDEEESGEDEETAMIEYADILPIADTTDIVPANELSMYDFSSNRTITYQELAELCLSQARKSLISQKARTLEVETIEKKKRTELTNEINKYFDLNEIAEDLNAREQRLDKLSLEELQILRKQCEDKFDMLKTKDMIKNALATIEIGYDAWFPDGIPIGKERLWQLDSSIPKDVEKALFDVRTVPGHAFRRILDKHHIHLPDEVTVLLELSKIILKGSHIVRRDELEDEEEEDEEEEENEEEDDELEEVDD